MTAQPMTTRIALLALVAAVQIAILGKIVTDRVSLLRTGREIVLPITPVDPRDLFRGDYVILAYPLSQIAAASLPPGTSLKNLRENRDVYVVIHPEPDQSWKIVAVEPAYPKTVATDDAVLKGRVVNIWNRSDAAADEWVQIHYGIERYFVPEGTGRALEERVQERAMQAIVAVGADGAAALKGLILDGKRHEDPPLF